MPDILGHNCRTFVAINPGQVSTIYNPLLLRWDLPSPAVYRFTPQGLRYRYHPLSAEVEFNHSWVQAVRFA